MVGKNVNYGSNYGNIGDQYIQVVRSQFNGFLESGGGNNSQIRSGQKYILMLELFDKHADDLEREFKKNESNIRNNWYPLKIRVTQLVDDCAQGVYYNNGNTENDVREIVDSVFVLACNAMYGSNFCAKRVCVGSQIYYEVYPARG